LANQEELRQLSIEESKFLGGDVEHTHLVKGLDFALLQKVREEMTESVKDEEYARAAGGAAGRGEAGADGAGAAGHVAADGKVATFGSAMARFVYDLTVRTYAQRGGGGDVKPNERFASGRVSFTFDVSVAGGGEDGGAGSDIPTTTMRSRSDVDAAKGGSTANMMLAGRDAAVLERLSKIMVYLRLGGKAGKKMKRKDLRAEATAAAAWGTAGAGVGRPGGGGVAAVTGLRQPQEQQRPKLVVPEEDDMDIFGDVGREYEPTVAKKENAESDKAASYFGDGHDKGGEASAVLPTASSKVGSAGAGVSAGADAQAAAGGSSGDGISVDANGLVGPMPEPPAPDFKSMDQFKAHHCAYIAAGSILSSDGKAERWDPNAAGSYLQTCPDFALAITSHSLTVLEAEEAVEEAAHAARGGQLEGGGRGKGEGARLAVRAAPLDPAAAKAELERRAEASLAPDDGYAECYAGFDGYADAVYESDDDEDGGAKKNKEKDVEEDEAGAGGGDIKGTGKGGGKGGGKAGLGAGGKGGKIDVKAMEAQRDQRLNSELGNLHKMMKDKYGDKVDEAFGGGGDAEAESGKSGNKGGGNRGEKRGGGRGGGGGGDKDGEGGGGVGGRKGKRLKI